ncbi:hypothetical protein GUJ93_ZPchr0006g41982 [Zizania palustris]|uniref:Dof zinc finger protein n=1 Tax=Zizania palustris TaxID=103762 RepID=A0A8J5T6I6_ZIZPA|nr:hypothetical protein GUJ93_ZPchr0006g41982 [Zizania palustris]
MQEFQPVPGLPGRLFGGAAAPGPPKEVRCPRCDSANTKFCYYNNYNLSQPRHFCKGCRRYWTKGGLLRNVPVGGGSRKPKRVAPSSASAAHVDSGGDGGHGHRDVKNARSAGCCTGSDSSSVTTTSTAAPASSSSNASSATTQPSSAGATGTSNVTFAADALPQPPLPTAMFADQSTAFASLFAPPPPNPLPFFSSFTAQPKADEDVAPALTSTEQHWSASSSFTSNIAPFGTRSGGPAPAASPADWPPPTMLDAGMFDLAGSISGDTSYWNPASWTEDPDGILYQLP